MIEINCIIDSITGAGKQTYSTYVIKTTDMGFLPGSSQDSNRSAGQKLDAVAFNNPVKVALSAAVK